MVRQKKYGANLEFSEGWGANQKNPPWGGGGEYGYVMEPDICIMTCLLSFQLEVEKQKRLEEERIRAQNEERKRREK